MGSIDTNNSYNSPLVGTETYIGAFTSTTNWAEVCISIECDSSFYLVVNFSSDGVNTALTKSANVATTSNALIYNYPPYYRYVQVQLTNTGNAQTYLRLQTMFKATQNYTSTIATDVNIVNPLDANGYVEVNCMNLVPNILANTLLVQYATVGNWYKVESLGNTSGAVWNAMGSIIGGESAPPVGRVFKALDYGNGTGTISTIIYSQNTKDVNLATCISSGNVSVLINNTNTIPVSDAYLASITYTGSNVNVYDANLASVIKSGNVSVLINNTNTIPVSDAYLASITYTGSNVNVYDANLNPCIVNSNVNVYDTSSNTKLQTLIDQTLLNGGVFWNAVTVANNAFSNVVDFSTKNAIIYSFFGNVAPVNVDNAIVLTAYFSGDGTTFYKSDINISPLDPIAFGPTTSDFCSSIGCGAAYVKLQITGLTGNCVITAIVNQS